MKVAERVLWPCNCFGLLGAGSPAARARARGAPRTLHCPQSTSLSHTTLPPRTTVLAWLEGMVRGSVDARLASGLVCCVLALWFSPSGRWCCAPPRRAAASAARAAAACAWRCAVSAAMSMAHSLSLCMCTSPRNTDAE